MDIRDGEKFLAGRWAWDALGYSSAFPGAISFSDIDAVVERKGRFLFLEMKEYRDNREPGSVPTGQRILLERLAKLEECEVYLIEGRAATGEPMYVKDMKRGTVADLRAGTYTTQDRKDFLHKLFQIWNRSIDELV